MPSALPSAHRNHPFGTLTKLLNKSKQHLRRRAQLSPLYLWNFLQAGDFLQMLGRDLLKDVHDVHDVHDFDGLNYGVPLFVSPFSSTDRFPSGAVGFIQGAVS